MPTHSTNEPQIDVPCAPDVSSPPPRRRFRERYRWLAAILGMAALLWFLVRVLPKPGRASYPCQRAAFPVATGFIIWLMSLCGFGVAWRKGRQLLANAKYAPALACFILAAFLAVEWWNATPDNPALAVFNTNVLLPNHPVGTAKGIFPGRVTWVFDPDATFWDGVTVTSTTDPVNNPYKGWWGTSTSSTGDITSSFIRQANVNTMMANNLLWLTGANTEGNAWDALFRYFNKHHSANGIPENLSDPNYHAKGDVGYVNGEKIFIKTNWVTSSGSSQDASTRAFYSPPPEIVIALVNKLTTSKANGGAGVSPSNIFLGDTIRNWPQHVVNKIQANVPAGIVYIGSAAGSSPSSDRVYFSNGATGNQTYVPSCIENAAYVINLAQMKTHARNGVTLSAKNYFGAMGRSPNAGGYYNAHAGLLANNEGGTNAYGQYRVLVDLSGHPKLGGNVLLYIMDALYSGYDYMNISAPREWYSEPFRSGNAARHWPSSILMSLDPVAIDSVCLDLWKAERTAADAAGRSIVWSINAGLCDPARTGVEDYLVEMAMADAPFSGITYRPDGTHQLSSLGTFEHWSTGTSTTRKYSRNLGTGFGIELVTAPPTVAGRWVFYNNSAWDDPANGGSDDLAVAPDKTPLLPGGTASFINYTSFSKGINGVMIDVPNVPVGQDPATTDFLCTVGNNNSPAGWTAAPTFAVSIRRTQGFNGSDRITLTWADKAITGKWLRVQMFANTTKNLPADVLYIGNAPGDTGNFTIDATVNNLDENAVLNDPHDLVSTGARGPATITNPNDFNRDRKVDATDAYVARHYATNSSTALQLITVP